MPPAPTAPPPPTHSPHHPHLCLQDFDLTLEPVEVEDPRTPDQVAPWASLPDGEAVFQW